MLQEFASREWKAGQTPTSTIVFIDDFLYRFEGFTKDRYYIIRTKNRHQWEQIIRKSKNILGAGETPE